MNRDLFIKGLLHTAPGLLCSDHTPLLPEVTAARALPDPSPFGTLWIFGDWRATPLHTGPPDLERAYVVVTMLLTFETQEQFTVGTCRAGIQPVGISGSQTGRKSHTTREINPRSPGILVVVVVLSPSRTGTDPSPRSIGPIN